MEEFGIVFVACFMGARIIMCSDAFRWAGIDHHTIARRTHRVMMMVATFIQQHLAPSEVSPSTPAPHGDLPPRKFCMQAPSHTTAWRDDRLSSIHGCLLRKLSQAVRMPTRRHARPPPSRTPKSGSHNEIPTGSSSHEVAPFWRRAHAMHSLARDLLARRDHEHSGRPNHSLPH